MLSFLPQKKKNKLYSDFQTMCLTLSSAFLLTLASREFHTQHQQLTAEKHPNTLPSFKLTPLCCWLPGSPHSGAGLHPNDIPSSLPAQAAPFSFCPHNTHRPKELKSLGILDFFPLPQIN